MRIPKEISPCPIIEAIVELRIQSSSEIPIDAVFGLVYEKLHSVFPKIANLPSLNIPEQVRESDPNLRYQAQHRLSNDTFSLSVGPRVLVFSCAAPYAGWERFFEVIRNSLDSLLEVDGLISGVERLGVRFVNFFSSSIEESIDFGLSAPRLNVEGCQFHTTLMMPDDEFANTIQLANGANIVIEGKSEHGSLVDIDTYRMDKEGKLVDDLYDFIERGHQCEKRIFFSLLKEEILASLNPEY